MRGAPWEKQSRQAISSARRQGFWIGAIIGLIIGMGISI